MYQIWDSRYKILFFPIFLHLKLTFFCKNVSNHPTYHDLYYLYVIQTMKYNFLKMFKKYLNCKNLEFSVHYSFYVVLYRVYDDIKHYSWGKFKRKKTFKKSHSATNLLGFDMLRCREDVRVRGAFKDPVQSFQLLLGEGICPQVLP